MTTGAGRYRPETSLLWLAGFLLLLGAIVYAVDRGGNVYFLPDSLTHGEVNPVLGSLAEHLPSLVHTLAFIAITTAVLWPWPRLLPVTCLSWLVIECAFELGQIDAIGDRIAASTPAWVHGVPVLEEIPDFFAQGTYDPLDVLAIGLGAIVAYLGLRYVYEKEQCDVATQ